MVPLSAMAELEVPRINPVGGALRLGVLYDLLGRTVQRDSRAATVELFAGRYRVDRDHAQRVATMAKALYLAAAPVPDAAAAQRVEPLICCTTRQTGSRWPCWRTRRE